MSTTLFDFSMGLKISGLGLGLDEQATKPKASQTANSAAAHLASPPRTGDFDNHMAASLERLPHTIVTKL
jgi:hypothetical protein